MQQTETMDTHNNRVQRDGIAPNSGHILWTKITEDGGVVGGDEFFSTDGETFNAGHQYQTRYAGTQIIMHGRLLYREPVAWAGTGGDWVCVDLKTGQEIWRNKTMTYTPQFGYYYDLDDMNQHGVVNPGYIVSQYTSRLRWTELSTTGHSYTQDTAQPST